MSESIRVLPSKGFDYINTIDPSVSVNPPTALVTWLNATSGEIFVCTDNTAGSNVWVSPQKQYMASLTRVSTSFAANGTWQVVSFDTEAVDDLGMIDLGSSATKIIIPAGCNRAIITGSIESGIAAQQVFSGSIYKNGSALSKMRTYTTFPQQTLSWSGIVSESDEIELYINTPTVTANLVSTLTVTCWKV